MKMLHILKRAGFVAKILVKLLESSAKPAPTNHLLHIDGKTVLARNNIKSVSIGCAIVGAGLADR